MRWVRSFCRGWTRVRPNNFCSFLGTAPKFYHLRQEIASEAGADQREIVCKRGFKSELKRIKYGPRIQLRLRKTGPQAEERKDLQLVLGHC